MRTNEQTTTIRCQENQENDLWQVRRNCRKNADTEWVIVQKDQWSHYHHAGGNQPISNCFRVGYIGHPEAGLS